jgi:hypothetical protein
MLASGNQSEQRKRLVGMQVQLIAVVLLIYLFGRNAFVTCRALVSRYYNLPLWCSFLSSLIGTQAVTTFLLTPLLDGLNCRIAFSAEIFGIGFSMLCNSVILFYKAYSVLSKQKWVLYVGISLILPQVVYWFLMIYYSYFIVETTLGCSVYYPQFMIWYWASVNIPLNTLSSAVFCHATYK